MTAPDASRYSRQTLAGWQGEPLRAARVLVVGAGALGNEVLKNLVLLGIGHITIADMDAVEISNLSRCVLFRDEDLGKPKASVAAACLRRMAPDTAVTSLQRNIVDEVGAGSLRDFDLVLGCVDNIEARLAINRLCRAVCIPWLDGGMDARGGQVSYFHPEHGACYECGMTAAMWSRVHERQSCLRMGSGEAADAVPMAATVTMAGMIGALQAQEAVRLLLAAGESAAREMQPGSRVCLHTEPYQAVTLQAQPNPECAAHAAVTKPVRMLVTHPAEMTAERLLELTGGECMELAWDLVAELHCDGCGTMPVALCAQALTRELLQCPVCGHMRLPTLQSTVYQTDRLARHTLAKLCVPPQAILPVRLAGSGAWVCIELRNAAPPRRQSGGRIAVEAAI